MIHELKIAPEYFEAVRNETKTFELRKHDRDFKVGDYLALNEWREDYYTGRTELVKVTYVLETAEIMKREQCFVVMSIARCFTFDRQEEADK